MYLEVSGEAKAFISYDFPNPADKKKAKPGRLGRYDQRYQGDLRKHKGISFFLSNT